MYFSNFTKKLFISFVIACSLLYFPPYIVHAQVAVIDPVTNAETTVTAEAAVGTQVTSAASAVANNVNATVSVWEKFKHNILDPLAWAVGKKIVAKITAQTVNYINSGFKGNPGFVTNPGEFFLNVGDQAVSDFISKDPRLNSLCTAFKADVRLALVKNYLTDDQNYSCSLSKIKNNFEGFMADFSQGGWEGWFEVTQNDQNNPYGAYLAGRELLSINIGSQKNKYQKQIDLGNGILSAERCKKEYVLTADQAQLANDGKDPYFSGPIQKTPTDGEGNPAAPSDPTPGSPDFMGPTQQFKAGDCYNAKGVDVMETVTPGSVINDSLKKALGSGIDQLNLADSFNEIIGALATNMFKRVVGQLGGGGLKGAGSKNTMTQNTITYENSIPIIALIGSEVLNVQVGLRFDDPGAVAIDSVDGDISQFIQVTGTFDTATVGQYELSYDVTNSQGNSAKQAKRIINVMVDVSAPGAICKAISDGRGNDINPQFDNNGQIDPKFVVFDQSEISSWKQTAKLNGVTVGMIKTNFNYTNPGWPAISIGSRPTADVIGSAWVLVWRYQNFPNLTISPNSRINLDEMIVSLTQQKDVIEQIITRIKNTRVAKIWLKQPSPRYGGVILDSVQQSIEDLFSFNYSTSTVSLSPNRLVKFNPSGVLQNAIYQMNSVNDELLNNKDNSMVDFVGPLSANWGESIGPVIDIRDKYRDTNIDPSTLNSEALELVGAGPGQGKLLKVPATIQALIDRINLGIRIADQLSKGITVSGVWRAIPFTYIRTSSLNDLDTDALFCADKDFKPTEGDKYGFMVSTPANNTNALNRKEKSNIFTYQWPTVTRVAPPQTPRTKPVPPPTGGGECAPPPTTTEAQQQSDSIAFMMPLLGAIPLDNPVTSPPSGSYQATVQNIVDQVNYKYPLVGAAYAAYTADNTIAMNWKYAVGPVPVDHPRVSNIFPNSQTIWQVGDRSFCSP